MEPGHLPAATANEINDDHNTGAFRTDSGGACLLQHRSRTRHRLIHSIIRAMRAIHLISAFLVMLVLPQAIHAGEPLVLAPGKGSVYIYGGSASATRYYNVNGDLKRFDTLRTEFTATTFGLTVNYGLMDDLELNLDVPIGYYSLTSQTRLPDRSIFSPTYYGVGATYQLSRGKVNASVSAMVKVPPGFHNGIYDDPKHPSFLSDGFLQASAGLNFGFNLTENWFKGNIAYNWRDEEPADEILYNAEVGLSKVPGIGIFVGINGVQSTVDATHPTHPFYAGTSGSETEQARIDGGRGEFRTIDRENYFAVYAGAYVNVIGNFFLSGKYAVRLFGTNTLVLPGAYLGAGYNF